MRPVLPKEKILHQYFWLWPLFTLQAGLINSGGFLSSHQFVTHVTGFGTRVGVEFLQNKFFLGLELLLIPIGFIVGCMVAGMLAESEKKWINGHTPLYLVTGILLLVATFGNLGFFGSFGEPLILARDMVLLTLLCFTAGIQNATIVAITAGVVRTTHMTGISTDIGLDASRMLLRRPHRDSKWFSLRFLKLIFFSVGAAIGAYLFTRFEYGGFVVPAILNLVLTGYLSYTCSPNESRLPHQGNASLSV